MKFKNGDKVFLIDTLQRYSPITKWDNELKKKVGVFSWETDLTNTYDIHKFEKGMQLEIIESMQHPSNEEYELYLCKHKHDYIVVNQKGISYKTPEQLEKEKIDQLKKENLGKWSIDDNNKEFPKELLEVYYDTDQKVLFGSHYTKGVVTYGIIPAEYTVDGIALYAYSDVDYNGKGCSLENKKTIDWEGLKKLCKNNTFIG